MCTMSEDAAPKQAVAVIRPASLEDAATIISFNCSIAAETEGLELDRETTTRGVLSLLQDPQKGQYFVAEVASQGDDGTAQVCLNVCRTFCCEKEAFLRIRAATAWSTMWPFLYLRLGRPCRVQSALWRAVVCVQIAGQIMVTYEWSDWRCAQVWWIQSVYVAKEHRRRGIYTQLHQHVVAAARAAGACGVRLYADTTNKVAHATYEGVGMTSHYIVYESMF